MGEAVEDLTEHLTDQEGTNQEGAAKTANITLKELIPSFWLSQILLFVPGIFLLWFLYLRNGYELSEFFSFTNTAGIWVSGTLAALAAIGLQWLAWKIFSLSAFDDGGINLLLLSLPMQTLIPMFAFGAFAEELLVRGVLQTGIVNYFGPLIGVLLTSIIFSAMHVRYVKKPVLLGGAFLISLFLGSLYFITGTLWASVWAHFIYNCGAAILAKKIYLPLIKGQD